MKTILLIRSLCYKIFFVFDQITGLNKHAVTVLCYHSFSDNSNRYSVTPSEFEKQMQTIRKYSDFISLSELKEYLNGKTPDRSKVLITIDDGYRSIHKITPIIQKYSIPVVLFVLSNPKAANRKELDTDEELLSWDDLSVLVKKGWVIGSHSATHNNFSKLSDTELAVEVATSKEQIEMQTKSPVEVFAYPKGIFTHTVLAYMKSGPYTLAFTTLAGTIKRGVNPLLLPRTIIDHTHSFHDFPALYSRSWLWFRTITNRLQLWERFLS